MDISSKNMATVTVAALATLFLALLTLTPFIWCGAMMLGMRLFCPMW
jgi:hypothetical protein